MLKFPCNGHTTTLLRYLSSPTDLKYMLPSCSTQNLGHATIVCPSGKKTRNVLLMFFPWLSLIDYLWMTSWKARSSICMIYLSTSPDPLKNFDMSNTRIMRAWNCDETFLVLILKTKTRAITDCFTYYPCISFFERCVYF